MSGKKAALATTSLPVGAQAITAVYSGDITYASSTSAVLTQTVKQASSTTTVTSLPSPSVYGQPVSFAATVSASSPGSGTPTGTVTFSIGSTVLGTATLSGGSGSITTASPLAVGNDTIKASYSGDTNFKTGTGTVVQTVNQDSTTTSLASSANPSVFGQSVTLTATVSANAPGSGAPAGSVTFMDGTTTLGTVTVSGGSASYSTTKLAPGHASVTATYNGNASFITGTAGLTQIINQDSTTTAVSSSPSISVYGQSVTFSVTVSATAPGGGTPTGSVTLTYGSTTLGSASLSGGKATIKTNALPAGTDVLTATYGGDTNFLTSTATLTQVVNQDSTTTKLTSSANSSVFGQTVTFTATVSAASPGSGTPTGMVTFYDGTTDLGTGSLSSGAASFTISTLSVGSNSITGVYGGDSNFMTSTSAALTQTVKQAGTTTSVVSSANPSVAGQAVTFTATVSPVSPGTGTPTGTATFMDGSKTLGTAAAQRREAASFTSSALAVGTHSIKVLYGGDANFKTSTSSVLSQVVQSSADVIVARGTSQVVDQVFGTLSTGDWPVDASLLHDSALEQVRIGSRRTQRLSKF